MTAPRHLKVTPAQLSRAPGGAGSLLLLLLAAAGSSAGACGPAKPEPTAMRTIVDARGAGAVDAPGTEPPPRSGIFLAIDAGTNQDAPAFEVSGCGPGGVAGGGASGRGADLSAGGGRAGAGGTAGGAGGTGGAGGPAGGGGESGGPVPDPVRDGAVPQAGELGVVELLINPAGTDTGREWVEVLNRSAHPLSLAGLHLADAVNDSVVEFGGAAPPVLAPGQRAVLVQSGDATKNGGVVLGAAPPSGLAGGTFGTLVSLNNDADQISLCQGPCGSGTLLDRVSWDAALGPGFDGHALVLDAGGKRCAATQPFGDAGSFGTPGSANPPCP